MHSELLLDHFRNPRNAGTLDPPAVRVTVENLACGDILELSALIKDGTVERAAFRVRGCTASIAAGSALTELLAGRRLDAIASLRPADVDAALGGLAAESKHAAVLAIDGVKALLSAAGRRS